MTDRFLNTKKLAKSEQQNNGENDNEEKNSWNIHLVSVLGLLYEW